jgi:hypothetical protein
MSAALSDLASVFRSKNAEPFLTTIDIYFPGPTEYERVKLAGVLTPQTVAAAYRMPPEAVHGIHFVDPIHTIKVSIYKYADGQFLGQGDPEMSDMYGAQQHIPLLDIRVP